MDGLILLLQKDCTPLLVIVPISIQTHYFLMYAVGLEQFAVLGRNFFSDATNGEIQKTHDVDYFEPLS